MLNSFFFAYCTGEECRLPGSIPSALFSRKTSLELIDLESTELVGNIPAVFNRMVNLTYLDLSENKLVGRLPTQLLQIQKLKELIVYDNLLTGAIPQFSALSNLERLDLVSLSCLERTRLPPRSRHVSSFNYVCPQGKNQFVINAFTVFDTLPKSLKDLSCKSSCAISISK